MRRARGLFETATSFAALCDAAGRAARGKRHKPHVARFLMDLEPEVLALRRELVGGTWRPGPCRVFSVADPKPRTICAAPFRDRVVHHALCDVAAPVFERYAIFDSYACRPGKGVLSALRRARCHARRHPYFVKLDVRRYFASIDHDVLRGLVRRLIADRAWLAALDHIVAAGAPGSPPGRGLPIGNLTSQHLANLYLGPLDHHVKEALRVPGYCRYMDDLLLFGPGRATVTAWRRDVERFLEDRLGLEVKTKATVAGPVTEGIPFLGFRVFPGVVRLDGRRVRRLRRRLSALDRALAEGRLDEDEAALAAGGLVSWAEHGDARRLLASHRRRRATLASGGEEGSRVTTG